jgi:hypothetical protein
MTMSYRTFVVCAVFLAFATVSGAQQPNGHIDLDAIARLPRGFVQGEVVVTGVSFVETDAQCVEDHGTLRASGGRIMFLLIPTPPSDDPLAPRWATVGIGNGNDAVGFRYRAPRCQMDITVRQQFRRDGTWIPSRKYVRPMFPWFINAPQAAESSDRQEAPPPQKQRNDVLSAIGSAGSLPPFGGWTFTVEDGPETCVEALGDYRTGRSGLQLNFFVPLPGDFNRFVIERADSDANSGRLYFTYGDCRWEVTVSMSIPRDGRWIALPVAPASPTKG